MIQNLRQIKNRIRGVRSTLKITHAMEMVAAAKLNRIKQQFYSARPYFLNMEEILAAFLSDAEANTHPLLSKRDDIRSITVCVISSDTGLCGPYNHNIMHFAEGFLGSHSKEKVRLVTVGKEAHGYFHKRSFDITKSYLGLHGKYSQGFVEEITPLLCDDFISGRSDEAYLLYTDFSSALRHKPLAERILPVELPKVEKREYILEPGRKVIMDSIVAKYILSKIRLRLLTSLTSEHSARMLAMKTATDNANELIGELELMRNKARQTAITKEVLEVVMSAEALKE